MSLEQKNPYGVLIAGQADEEAIYAHVLSLHKENGMWPLSGSKVWQVIKSATRQDGPVKNIIGLIKGAGGSLQGSICLEVGETYYSNWLHFFELWNYVDPLYRTAIDTKRRSHVQRLIDFAKWCADTMSLNIAQDGGQPEFPLIIGILTQDHLEGKIRLYQRRGLQQIGATFMYRAVPMNSFNQKRVVADKIIRRSISVHKEHSHG